MSVHDALPGDIFVDEQGKLWRCMSICNEPMRTFVEIEPPHANFAASQKCGGVSGLMWRGWKRVWRKEAAE